MERKLYGLALDAPGLVGGLRRRHRAEVFRYGDGWVVRIANELLRSTWREADEAKAVAERVLGITLRHATPSPQGAGRRLRGRGTSTSGGRRR